VSPNDYVADDEFKHVYRPTYLAEGKLTGNEKKDRLTLLLNDQYLIQDNMLYRLVNRILYQTCEQDI